MKKFFAVLVLLFPFVMQAGVFIPAAGAASDQAKEIVIGVTPFPHKDIMLVAQKLLAAEGYNLIIREFTDYVQPNLALADGQLDANFFQHVPYLDNMNREAGLNLVWVAKIHIEPMGLYSKRISSPDGLKKGDTLSVPNDPTNEARALRLLEAHGVIALKPGELVTVRDITENPLDLKILEMDAALLPRTLEDVAAAVINTNFAGEAGLIPSRDALVIEPVDSPYANVIAVRAEDRDSPAIQALVRASRSAGVKDFIVTGLEPRGIVAAF